MKETLTLVFIKDGETLRHEWTVKKGFKGAREANKVRKLQSKWGDPVEIIGDGPIAKLLRKEYAKYNLNQAGYEGVSTKDVLKAGAEITGVPVEKLQSISRKIKKKIKNHI